MYYVISLKQQLNPFSLLPTRKKGGVLRPFLKFKVLMIKKKIIFWKPYGWGSFMVPSYNMLHHMHHLSHITHNTIIEILNRLSTCCRKDEEKIPEIRYGFRV